MYINKFSSKRKNKFFIFLPTYEYNCRNEFSYCSAFINKNSSYKSILYYFQEKEYLSMVPKQIENSYDKLILEPLPSYSSRFGRYRRILIEIFKGFTIFFKYRNSIFIFNTHTLSALHWIICAFSSLFNKTFYIIYTNDFFIIKSSLIYTSRLSWFKNLPFFVNLNNYIFNKANFIVSSNDQKNVLNESGISIRNITNLGPFPLLSEFTQSYDQPSITLCLEVLNEIYSFETCFNYYKRVMIILNDLSSLLGIKFFIRPHPRETKKMILQLKNILRNKNIKHIFYDSNLFLHNSIHICLHSSLFVKLPVSNIICLRFADTSLNVLPKVYGNEFVNSPIGSQDLYSGSYDINQTQHLLSFKEWIIWRISNWNDTSLSETLTSDEQDLFRKKIYKAFFY